MSINKISSVLTKFREDRGGFTLVELLIVVAIIAILAAIAIPQFTKYRLRGYKAEIDSDAKNAYTAAQAYLTDNPSTTIDSLAKLTSGGYTQSGNISLVGGTGTMTLTSGNIKLESAPLKTQFSGTSTAYTAQVDFDGAITQVVLP
ncbi:MAG: prepilin-type N-terminal cleavage/methylation domain-containing protein [Thermodesulfobacteriota bacterium]